MYKTLIQPLLKKDDFGRPLGININHPTSKYVWLEKGVTVEGPEGWYFIDNNEGEPAYWVDAVTVSEDLNWKENSKSKWD